MSTETDKRALDPFKESQAAEALHHSHDAKSTAKLAMILSLIGIAIGLVALFWR